jgi:predicted RecA/RadA family phage recombinase
MIGKKTMRKWARTAEGWAVNLDGSDARTVFTLPRVEVRSSSQGWRLLCLLSDGTQRERAAGSLGSVGAAKAAAIGEAGRMLGPEHASAVAELLEAPIC